MSRISTVIGVFCFLTLAWSTSANGAPIEKPILRTAAGKAAACLTQLVTPRFLTPGQKVLEWRGPGMKADPSGEVDRSIALFIVRVGDPEAYYALVFLSQDDNGWSMFGYQEGNQYRLGMRARNMERIAYWQPVKPHEASGDQLGAMEDAEELDISACEKELQQ